MVSLALVMQPIQENKNEFKPALKIELVLGKENNEPDGRTDKF